MPNGEMEEKMDKFIVNIIHRPEMVPEYAEKARRTTEAFQAALSQGQITEKEKALWSISKEEVCISAILERII